MTSMGYGFFIYQLIVGFNRHSAPVSGINLTIPLSENIHDCLVNRVQAGHLRWRTSNTVLVYPAEAQEDPTRRWLPSSLFRKRHIQTVLTLMPM